MDPSRAIQIRVHVPNGDVPSDERAGEGCCFRACTYVARPYNQLNTIWVKYSNHFTRNWTRVVTAGVLSGVGSLISGGTLTAAVIIGSAVSGFANGLGAFVSWEDYHAKQLIDNLRARVVALEGADSATKGEIVELRSKNERLERTLNFAVSLFQSWTNPPTGAGGQSSDLAG